MTVKNPPIQDNTLIKETGRFTTTWIRWFQSLTTEINIISGGGP